MNAVFTLQVNELNSQFLNTIKTLFKGDRLSVVVSDEDETEYLLSSAANRNSIDRALESKEGYRFTPAEFKKLSIDLLAGKKLDLSRLKKVKLSA